MLELDMQKLRNRAWQPHAFGAFLLLALAVPLVEAQEKTSANPGPAITKAVGTIKSVHAESIMVVAESGENRTATLSPSTKIMRVPPGEKDLKNATPLQAQDLQEGDRVLVRGPLAADGLTIAALAVIVMKQADVAARQQQDREDWQKRGVGGLVTKIDVAAGTIAISTNATGASKTVVVRLAKGAVLRRYAPGSVKFNDAKPAPLDQIRMGDQLLARGARNADGTEIAAEVVVTGSFRNIAGTIKAVDAANNTFTVQDAISKTAVTLKVSGDSQMKKLPAEIAQRIAMRLKGGAVGGEPRGNEPPDLQRVLARLPDTKLEGLQKGDAVMLVATDGGSDGITVITLLAGVEPILTAAPDHGASLLSPWSLSTGGGEGP
jgi:hypothetical protein